MGAGHGGEHETCDLSSYMECFEGRSRGKGSDFTHYRKPTRSPMYKSLKQSSYKTIRVRLTFM